MVEFDNDENVVKFAVKHYYTPQGIDFGEFYDDLKRFKYIKRLVNRYTETGTLSERLILNHLIVAFNVFGNYGCLKLLEHKLDEPQWPVVKPFLTFLNIIKPHQYRNVEPDPIVVQKLGNI